jgi:HlyD family secretion protein
VYEDLVGSTANRKEELGSRRYAAEAAQANVDLAEANLSSSEAVLAQHTINAPVDGVVLRRNVREGEFAQAGVLASPLMVVGNIIPLHVRVQIDETQAQQVREGAAAVGTVRGAPDKAIPLKFVRKEPLVIPKRFLSGDAGERSDTRILEVIYALEGAQDAAFVGQQMDVFIER